MFKSAHFGGKSTVFSLFAFRYVVVALARWTGALGKRSMHNEEKFRQFPEFLVHFVLLILFVVVCFFETMSTFYQKEFPWDILLTELNLTPPNFIQNA